VFGLLLTRSQQSTPKQGSPRREAPTGSQLWSNTTVDGQRSDAFTRGCGWPDLVQLRSRATVTEASDEYGLGHVHRKFPNDFHRQFRLDSPEATT
jgi:hypothetical protein